MEPLEDALLFPRRNTDALVHNPHDNLRAGRDLARDEHLAAARTVFDRVLHQVEERAAQLVGVTPDQRKGGRKTRTQAVARRTRRKLVDYLRGPLWEVHTDNPQNH